MIVDFKATAKYTDSLDIEDPGNTCIKCTNDDWSEYYLIIKTVRAVSHILEYGPIAPDINTLIEDFCVKYRKVKFNEKQIYKVISRFLNDEKKSVSDAYIDDAQNALEDIPEISILFNNIC